MARPVSLVPLHARLVAAPYFADRAWARRFIANESAPAGYVAAHRLDEDRKGRVTRRIRDVARLCGVEVQLMRPRDGSAPARFYVVGGETRMSAGAAAVAYSDAVETAHPYAVVASTRACVALPALGARFTSKRAAQRYAFKVSREHACDAHVTRALDGGAVETLLVTSHGRHVAGETGRECERATKRERDARYRAKRATRVGGAP
jgi:hypothetical protein